MPSEHKRAVPHATFREDLVKRALSVNGPAFEGLSLKMDHDKDGKGGSNSSSRGNTDKGGVSSAAKRRLGFLPQSSMSMLLRRPHSGRDEANEQY
jgi:hypothetical protein